MEPVIGPREITPFRLLGLSEDATRAQVQSAYRQLAKKHHPDHGGKARTFTFLQQVYEEAMAEVDSRPAPGSDADLIARYGRLWRKHLPKEEN